MDDFVINETKPPPKPERIVRGMPVDAARELLADHLRAIMAQVLRWHGTEIQFMEWNLGHPSPPHIAVRSTTGTGKSDIGRNELVRLVKAAKAAELPHRIIIAVPTHDLADEANFKMPRGVTTMIWQGRRAKQLGTKEPMCKNLDAVKAAEELGLTVQKAARALSRHGVVPADALTWRPLFVPTIRLL